MKFPPLIKLITIFTFSVDNLKSTACNPNTFVVAITEQSDDIPKHICDGSLIHPDWVITTENCENKYETFIPGLYFVIGINEMDVKVKRMVRSWQSRSLLRENDALGILHLEFPLSRDELMYPILVASEEIIKDKRNDLKRCSWYSITEGLL